MTLQEENENLRKALQAMLDECDPLGLNCGEPWYRARAALSQQTKPVRFCEDTALSLAERIFSSEVDEQLAEDVIRYARRLHDLYTVPQPEQSGLYTCVGKGGVYELIGQATAAGVLKERFGRFVGGVIVYRDTETNALYCREPEDFRLRMTLTVQRGEE